MNLNNYKLITIDTIYNLLWKYYGLIHGALIKYSTL